MSNRELIAKLRGMIRRVAIKNVSDDGETQTASIEVADGIWRDNIEISQQYGMTSNAPEDGGLAIAIAIGGDEGDMIVLPIGNPSTRMSGLGKGDVAMYNAFGDRVVIRQGGGIEVKAASSIAMNVGGVSAVLSAEGLAITGGKVTHNGKNIGDTHIHGGVVPGLAKTEPPAN